VSRQNSEGGFVAVTMASEAEARLKVLRKRLSKPQKKMFNQHVKQAKAAKADGDDYVRAV